MTLTPDSVRQAAARLNGVAHRTAVHTSRTLNAIAGADVYLKCENFQRVGAFKFRGAYNAMVLLSDEQKARGVIAYSSGNHAQGIALSGQLLGIPTTIIMPPNAPPLKRAATEGYGAEVIIAPYVDRETIGQRLARERGLTLIPPYDHDDVIAGQGTAAWELFEDYGPFDYLFVSVGGGGWLGGSALAAQALSPQCKIIGVEPAAGDDAGQSWRSGQIVALPQPAATMADGLRTRFISQRTLSLMQAYAHEMLTVTEAEIERAMRFVWNRMKLIIEPSSATCLAPLLENQLPAVSGKRVGVMISGGNVDLTAF